MHPFALLSSVLALAALFGLLSHRVLRLPPTVGTMVLALLLSGGLVLLGHASSGVGTMLSQDRFTRREPVEFWQAGAARHARLSAVCGGAAS